MVILCVCENWCGFSRRGSPSQQHNTTENNPQLHRHKYQTLNQLNIFFFSPSAHFPGDSLSLTWHFSAAGAKLKDSLTTAASGGVRQDVSSIGKMIHPLTNTPLFLRTGAACASQPPWDTLPFYEDINILLMSSPFQHWNNVVGANKGCIFHVNRVSSHKHIFILFPLMLWSFENGCHLFVTVSLELICPH